MQYQVPQFIETEDRIIGPLTLKQFGYLAAAGGISVLLFFTTNFYFWLLATLVVGAIGGSLAFIEINGEPLLRLAGSAFRYAWQPQVYVWKPENFEEPAEEREREAGFIERIAAGMALKDVWQQVQTGTAPRESNPPKRERERYQIFQRISGEQHAARRVDYR